LKIKDLLLSHCGAIALLGALTLLTGYANVAAIYLFER
jgi:hypothetical protein